MVRKFQGQEPEAVECSAPPVREYSERDAYFQWPLSFLFCPGPQTMQCYCPQANGLFPTQLPILETIS